MTGFAFCLTSFGQTNATDATVIDSEGTSHNLFTELDAGKIIVIGWTMPCLGCAAPLLAAHNAVLPFVISNPGEVEYWITDDYADITALDIEAWATNNGMTNDTYFSSTELDMGDYGQDGMPKVIVVGCTDHKVYYNKNNSPTESGVTAAINAALADIANSCPSVGLDEIEVSNFKLSCYPNPASSELNVSFTVEPTQNITLEIYGINGALLKNITLDKSNATTQEVQIDVNDLTDGIYVLKIIDGKNTEVEKFQIAH